MRPDSAYWKAYWSSYWRVRRELKKGKRRNKALRKFLQQPHYRNEAKAELIRLNQNLTAQAA